VNIGDFSFTGITPMVHHRVVVPIIVMLTRRAAADSLRGELQR
jgi:hypothetical protein